MERSVAFSIEAQIPDGTWAPLFDTTLLDGAWWEERWAGDGAGRNAAESLVDGLVGRRGALLEALTGYTRPPGLFEEPRETRLRSLLAPEGVDWGILRNGPPTPSWPTTTSALLRNAHHHNAAGWWLWSDALAWETWCTEQTAQVQPWYTRLWQGLVGDPNAEMHAQAQAVLTFAQGLDAVVRCVVGDGTTPWVGACLRALPDGETDPATHPFGATAHAQIAARATFQAARPWYPDQVRILLRAE
jgi:hypothetical protein